MLGEQIDFSMGEVTTLAKLATRGLGYSWGIAEDAGRAISWLEQRDLPGLILLARLCQHLDEHLGQVPSQKTIESGFRPQALLETWTARDGQLCPILSGIALSDGGLLESRHQKISAQNILYPLVILPFAAEVAKASNFLVDLKFVDSQVITNGEQIWIAPSPKTEPEFLLNALQNVVISMNPNRGAPSFEPWRKRRSRASVAGTVWAALDRFAHRTYAPATEESRIRGAGAGVSDND